MILSLVLVTGGFLVLLGTLSVIGRFGDRERVRASLLHREALPEEKRELIRLRVNQLVWTPDEIRLALLDAPPACQRLGESPQLVAQRPDSLNQ